MNKYIVAVLIFLAGTVAGYYIMPSKIETVQTEKIVEKVIHEKTDTHKTKITKPNGTIIEKEDSTTVSKTDEESQEKTDKKIITNPKKLNIYVGINPLKPNDYIAGFNYDVTGPLNVGIQYNKEGNGIYGTLGIRF